jgi:hypothetical protein
MSGLLREKARFGNLIPQKLFSRLLRSINNFSQGPEITLRERVRRGRNELVALQEKLFESRESRGIRR